LLRSGRRIKAKLIDARQLESESGFVRVAIVVPKWGFTAVRRNQLKRRLRELSRALLFVRESSRDVVLRARREAYDASFGDLRDDVTTVSAALT
jgi:ribonuclease P protein component